jgi:phosphoribosylanthranilate isomerase
MFRIKICGIREESDVLTVAAAGADAVGLNFHPASIRFLDEARAARLAALAHSLNLHTVGVFVSLSLSEMAATAERLGLGAVQLHGDQTVEDADWLGQRGFQVIRAIRLPTGKLEPANIGRHVNPWVGLGCPLLLDAAVGGQGGGLGARLDWEAIGRWASEPSRTDSAATVTWGLAGGLDSRVVGEAISLTGATAVDVASGVEEPRGSKSRSRIFAFVDAARDAWGERGTADSPP